MHKGCAAHLNAAQAANQRMQHLRWRVLQNMKNLRNLLILFFNLTAKKPLKPCSTAACIIARAPAQQRRSVPHALRRPSASFNPLRRCAAGSRIIAMKEIISINCGSSANYVGAHFWNLLDAACGAPFCYEPARHPARLTSLPFAGTLLTTQPTTRASCSEAHPVAHQRPGTPAWSPSTPKGGLAL